MKSLFDKVFAISKWSEKENYPPCDEWKANIEKHLQFMQDKDWLASIKPQLQSRNYESFLSEIFAAYFVERNLGFEVTGWNPRTNNGQDVEFCITDKADGEIFCEVKGPDWKSQLTKEEIQSGRTKQPKYSMFPEARYIAPWCNIRKAIDKSYEKFLPDEQNLLIITDNLFQPLPMGRLVDWHSGHKMPRNIWYALYNTEINLYGGKGYFETKDYENLGGILFLNDHFIGRFFAWFEDNPNAKYP